MRSRLRFIIALALAAVLGGWLIYSSIGGQTETYAFPSQLPAMSADTTIRLNGLVSEGAPADAPQRALSADGLTFRVHDKDKPDQAVTVLYRGKVPDAFKVGREVIITGRRDGDRFIAKRDSMTTLCPSKFQDKQSTAQTGS